MKLGEICVGELIDDIYNQKHLKSKPFCEVTWGKCQNPKRRIQC